MIGFDYLGKLGQLGNQMFQYAHEGIALGHKGYDFCIPNHDEVFHDGIGNHLKIELFKPFTLQTRNSIIGGRPIQERNYEFDDQLFNNCHDNVSLFGFYQTEKYFKHISDEIRQDFTFKEENTR